MDFLSSRIVGENWCALDLRARGPGRIQLRQHDGRGHRQPEMWPGCLRRLHPHPTGRRSALSVIERLFMDTLHAQRSGHVSDEEEPVPGQHPPVPDPSMSDLQFGAVGFDSLCSDQ